METRIGQANWKGVTTVGVKVKQDLIEKLNWYRDNVMKLSRKEMPHSLMIEYMVRDYCEEIDRVRLLNEGVNLLKDKQLESEDSPPDNPHGEGYFV